MNRPPRRFSPIHVRQLVLRLIERILPAPFADRLISLLRHEGTAGTAAKGSIAAFIIAAVGVVVSFAVQTSLARGLGETEYGTYSVVLVWMNVLLLFTKVELDIATTRFVGAYAATGDWSRLHGLLRYVPLHVFWRTLITAALAGIALFALRGSSIAHSVPAALMAIPLFVLTAQTLVRAAALQGFKRVVDSQLPNVVLRPAVLFVAVWLLLLSGRRLTPVQAVAFNVIGIAVALLVAERYLRRATPPQVAAAPPVSAMREWLRVGYGLVFISTAQLTLSQHTDLLLVAALIDRTSAAHYVAASQWAQVVAFASTAVMFIVAPLISELFAMRKLDTLRRFTQATVAVCMVISLTLLLAIAGFGRPLLGIYGAGFRAAYPALLLLAATHFVNATIGALAGWLMTMTGHERPAAFMIGGSAILNIALSVPLTLQYGLVGTAGATLVTTLVRSLMLSIYLRRKLGLLLIPGALGRRNA